MTSTGRRMLSEGEKEKTIRYISDRHCPGGGYCFFQLDEPNLSDTWYALGCLMTQQAVNSDETTEKYLSRFVDQTQGTSGLYRLWYLFWSYRYLTGTIPEQLITHLSSCPVPTIFLSGTIESASLFESLYCYAVLCKEAGIPYSESEKRKIQEDVQRWQHPSGGFGRDKATLIETRHAVAILHAFDIETDTERIYSFLTSCIDEQSGFVNVPSSHPGYLEHLDAGIALAGLLNRPVPNRTQCLLYLDKCRNANGGYARSGFGGNSTLEYTWYAIRSLCGLYNKPGWNW